jgi:hypothetical protein
MQERYILRGPSRTKGILYEQAVYGTFAFWRRGYAVLAASPGCHPQWLEALRLAAQRFGERPAGILERESLFALRLHRGPWMIVGVFPQGRDDRGRPGALAFHALFVGPWSYRRAGANPFSFRPALRGDWSADDEGSVLACGLLIPSGHRPRQACHAADARRVETIVASLRRGRRVTLISPEPIDRLAREVWDALPGRLRRRASVATWSFDNASRFDLVAVPRLAGLAPDADEIVLDLDPSRSRGEEPEGEARRPPVILPARRGWKLTTAILGPLVGLLAMVSFAWWREARRPGPPPAVTSGELAPSDRPGAERGRTAQQAPPRPTTDGEPGPTPDDRRRLIEALLDTLDRFCPHDEASGNPGLRRESGPEWGEAGREPGTLMVRLAGCLRYDGASLSDAELARLGAGEDGDGTGAGPSPDAVMALRWHFLTRRLVGDRPLPADFLDGPTRWQLSTLAWSFHVEDDPSVVQALAQGRPDEVVHALAQVLAVDVPVPATSLARRYPALDAYRAFLGRLPRR